MESFALEVDAAAEVLDDCRFGKLLAHGGDMQREGIRSGFTTDVAVAKGSNA